MIRPRGIGLVAVAVLIFLLGGFTGVGWLLVFDAMLWGTIVVSAVIPWLAVGRLDVRRPQALQYQSNQRVPERLARGLVLKRSLTRSGSKTCPNPAQWALHMPRPSGSPPGWAASLR